MVKPTSPYYDPNGNKPLQPRPGPVVGDPARPPAPTRDVTDLPMPGPGLHGAEPMPPASSPPGLRPIESTPPPAPRPAASHELIAGVPLRPWPSQR